MSPNSRDVRQEQTPQTHMKQNSNTFKQEGGNNTQTQRWKERERDRDDVYTREREEERLNLLEDEDPDPNIWNEASTARRERQRSQDG